MKKRELILKGDLKKAIIVISAPIMLSNFIQTIYNLTDTYWVSQIGATELAAMSLVWPLIFFMMSLGIGISTAGSTLIAQYVGSDDLDSAEKIAGQMLIFALAFSLIVGIIGYFLIPYIVSAIGAEGELYTKSCEFLGIMFLGMPTMFLMFTFNAIKNGQGETKTTMLYGAVSVAINIILDPILIFTFHMGIRGAAIATVFARGVVATYAIYRLFKVTHGVRLKSKNIKFNGKILKKLIKIGLPASIGQSMAAFGFAVLNIFIISFGTKTMTAFAIGNRINSLVLMPAMGVGSALATIVGQNLGADRIDRAKEAFKSSVMLNTIFMVIGGIIVFIFSESLIRIFAKNDVLIIEQGTFYLRLISATLPLVGYFQIFIGTFQGAGHMVMAMILTMGRLWALRIPMILLFKSYTNLAEKSIWYAMILSNVLICLIGLIMYLSGRWQKKIIRGKSYEKEKVLQPSK